MHLNVDDSHYSTYCIMISSTSLTIIVLFSDSLADRRRPDWWREVAYAGNKLLYQPVPQPIVYIVPVTDILVRLALVPYGEHGTIPYDRSSLALYYPRGECHRQNSP